MNLQESFKEGNIPEEPILKSVYLVKIHLINNDVIEVEVCGAKQKSFYTNVGLERPLQITHGGKSYNIPQKSILFISLIKTGGTLV